MQELRTHYEFNVHNVYGDSDDELARVNTVN